MATAYAVANDREVYRLVYCSTVMSTRFHTDLLAHIQVILEYSRFHNPISGITGVLLTNKKMFSQVIEGPEVAVKNLFGHIICDPRHRDVRLIGHHTANTRVFQEWSMAFIDGNGNFAAEHALFPTVDAQFDLLATAVYCAAVRRHLLAGVDV